MVRKAKTLTYFWSFSENLEDYKILFYDKKIALWQSDKNENNFCIVSGLEGFVET